MLDLNLALAHLPRQSPDEMYAYVWYHLGVYVIEGRSDYITQR